MDRLEHELDLLEYIAQRKESVHQRGLARNVGLSLGMTNAILRRLSQKGWLTIRKVNNRNIRYAVSPAGIEEIARRSYRYFKRTIKNIVDYREALDNLVSSLYQKGIREVVLVGASDIGFIVEQACTVQGVRFTMAETAPDLSPPGTAWVDDRFILYSENYFPGNDAGRAAGRWTFLQEVVHEAGRPG